MKPTNLLVLISSLLIFNGCTWWGINVVRPSWDAPPRPKIEVGVKQRADTFDYLNNEDKLKDYIIEHKDELKKDIITKERLKAHILKLENLLKGCNSKGGDSK